MPLTTSQRKLRAQIAGFPRRSAWDDLDDLIDTWPGDTGLKLNVGTDYAWSAELRWTPEPHNPDGPDRSRVWYAGGGGRAADVVAKVVEAAISEVDVPHAEDRYPGAPVISKFIRDHAKR